jgi:hypothetical protein
MRREDAMTTKHATETLRALASWAAFAIACAATPAASADALRYSAGGTLQGRAALTFGPYGGGAGWAAARWWDRLHTGVRVAGSAGGGVALLEETVEVGLWLTPSPRVDLLIAWRFGHAYLRLTADDGEPVGVNAFAIAAVGELAVHVTPTFDIRVMPLVVSGYYANLLQITIGPEVGVAWSF